MIQYIWICSESYFTNWIWIFCLSLRFWNRFNIENGILICSKPPWIEKSLIRLYRLFLNKMLFLVRFTLILHVYKNTILLNITYNFCTTILIRLVDLSVVSIRQNKSFVFDILINLIAILAVSLICAAIDFNNAIFVIIWTVKSVVL